MILDQSDMLGYLEVVRIDKKSPQRLVESDHAMIQAIISFTKSMVTIETKSKA